MKREVRKGVTMKSAARVSPLAWALAIALVGLVGYIVVKTPSCDGDFTFRLGGEYLLLFDCKRGAVVTPSIPPKHLKAPATSPLKPKLQARWLEGPVEVIDDPNPRRCNSKVSGAIEVIVLDADPQDKVVSLSCDRCGSQFPTGARIVIGGAPVVLPSSATTVGSPGSSAELYANYGEDRVILDRWGVNAGCENGSRKFERISIRAKHE